MEIVIVNFSLNGITGDEYAQAAEQMSPAFAEVPGLMSKVWLADNKNNV